MVQEGHLLLYQKEEKKVDRDVNVFQRILENEGGNEKVADV